MQLTGNVILISGGGTGIGRGLAEAFHALGNKVLIAGRRKAPLEEVTAANPGMAWYPLDIEDPNSIQQLAETLKKEHSDLNVLINMAGIMQAENLLEQKTTAIAEQTISINLLGTIRMNTALLPLLRGQQHATLINVSSGLATVPLAVTPTYCATKAAIHSYTESLRYQFRGTNLEVVELTPPYVGTELMAGGTANPAAMPLADFISETISLLGKKPALQEICVQRVLPLRDAVANGSYSQVFEGLNEAMKDLH